MPRDGWNRAARTIPGIGTTAGRWMKDILVVAKGMPPAVGGVETYSYEVARAYAAGHARRVIVLTQMDRPRSVTRRDRLVVINVGPGSQLRVFLRMIGVLRRLRRRSPGFGRFALFHATTWRVGIPLALYRHRPRLVVTIHGREVTVVPAVLRPVMRGVLRRAALVVGVSRSALAAARCSGANGLVAFNGLSATLRTRALAQRAVGQGVAADRLVILTLCRLIARKNVLGALEGIALLKQRGVGAFRYLVAGFGPLFGAVQEAVASYGLADEVRVLGEIPDEGVAALYEQGVVFLHPQVAVDGGRDFEGFGLAIADAMAFGLVPVAGLDGGPAEFIRHGETGLLVNGRDPAAIADALEWLLQHPDDRRRIGRAARDWALRELSWERHVGTVVRAVLNEVS